MAAESKSNDTDHVHPAQHKILTVVIRGCLHPPKHIKAIGRDGNTKQSSEDYTNDIQTVAQYYVADVNEKYYYLYKVHNHEQSNSMTCSQALKAIQEACQCAAESKAMMFQVYYIGLGEYNTGNWCFSDGVVSLEEVINAIVSNWKESNFNIVADCSFSGNWALDLYRYETMLDAVYVACASYPFKRANSHALGKGGLFTLWKTENLDRNNTKKLRDCKAKIEDGKYNIDYFAPKNNDAKFV